jgi:hypothetical protein
MLIPYDQLWKMALDVFYTVDESRPDTWMTRPINQLDPEEIESRFRKMKSGANKSKNEFEMMKLDGKPNNKPALFAGTLLRKLKNFEPWIRTVRALRTDGLKTKHVKNINDVINTENNDDSLNLI